MTKPAPMKAVKAWAVVRDDGETFGLHFAHSTASKSVEFFRISAGVHISRYKYRVIPVLVIPILRKEPQCPNTKSKTTK